MTDRNHRIRFMQNNFAKLTNAQIEYSSELPSFPFTNSTNPFRSRVWKTSGFFEIVLDSNDKLYINDGSDKTITLTGSFTTPALFASYLQTQLNAASSGWTVSYSSTTFSFQISRTSSATLRLSQTTNAVWDTIGFTTTTDLVGTSFDADQQRNHTEERVTFDLGYNATINFFAMIGPLDELFSISADATITLMASNLNLWDNPPLSVNISVTSKGAMRFLDDLGDTGYRFWRVRVVDRLAIAGPTAMSIGVLYLGDYLTLSNRNISVGFGTDTIDPSTITESESGALHFDTRTKYTKFSSASIGLLDRDDKDNLKQMFDVLGKTTPFFVSIDPTLCISNGLDEFTKYVIFGSEPSFNHVIRDIFSMTLEFREVV